MIESAVCSDLPPSRAEQRRRLVIDTARKLFTDHGFHATGMAQLAKDSGVAVGQIYRDFGSKEDIVAAICNADCRTLMMADKLANAIESGDSAGVRAWLRHLLDVENAGTDDRLFAEIVAEATRNARVATIFNDLRETFRANLHAALAMLAPGEALAERRQLVADAIMALSLGMMYFQLLHQPPDMAALNEMLVAFIDGEIDALCRETRVHAPA
jgi:AcrR family transcriptional regulator